MSSNYFKSKLEITFKFYYLGFAGIIFGFVLLYHGIIYFALPLVLSGIFLLLSPKGVMVDLTKRHVKQFYYFLFLKIGQWQNLDKYNLLVLGPNNSSKTIHGRYASHTIRNKSFSVYLLAEDKTKIEQEISNELQEALAGIRQLPMSSRRGVYLAYRYYLALFKKIRNVPPQKILSERVRVRDSHKLGLMFGTLVRYRLNLI